MSPSERIRRHLQTHIVAYLALFVALGGTAVALPGKNTVKSNDIARGAVKGKSLAADAVKKRKIRNAAVVNAKLADRAVTAPKLADGSVSAQKLAAGAVGTGALADSAVTRQKIAQGEVTGGKLDVAAVSSPKLAGDSVISTKVADGSLLAADFAPGQISDGFVKGPASTMGAGDPVGDPASYDPPRAGRLLLNATVTAQVTCSTACSRSLGLFVDGNLVSGSVRVLGGQGGSETRDLTLTGPAAVSDAPHTIEVRSEDSGTVTDGGFRNEALSGTLLQQ